MKVLLASFLVIGLLAPAYSNACSCGKKDKGAHSCETKKDGKSCDGKSCSCGGDHKEDTTKEAKKDSKG